MGILIGVGQNAHDLDGIAADRLKSLAEAAGIPVVGATETQPNGQTYQSWMMTEVSEIGKAFGMPTQ